MNSRRPVNLLNGSQPDRLVALLDDLERRVGAMRDQAAHVADEQSDIMQRLCDIQDAAKHASFAGSSLEREEIGLTTEKLTERCLCVDVSVKIPRSDAQKAALEVVEKLIEEIVASGKANPKGTYGNVAKLYNAALPDDAKGAIDYRFQGMLMDCCAEDQRRIRRRLERILADLKVAYSTNIETKA